MNKQTAIVTGASEGLGKAFALELAARNTDLLLVALPASGLPELAAFIRMNFNVRADIIETDLTQAESQEIISEHMRTAGIKADILINNAGIGNWAWFEDKSAGFYKSQIDLNITSTVLLSRMFLQQVNKNAPSYILNVGSLGGLFIVPKKQVYGATKSFISYFTRCLQAEQAGTQVHISLLSPGGINTKPELLVLNHSLKGLSKATILEPDEVAKIAIRGLLEGKKEIIPGALNRILVILNNLLPVFIKEILIRKNLKMALEQ